MAAGPSRKISAASARAHTRKPKAKVPSKFTGRLKKILLVCFMGFLAWAYQATRPPPPKTCGSTDGPPVTAPRIQLQDGRYLAYKNLVYQKILQSIKLCLFMDLIVAGMTLPGIVESQGLYFLSFDRPGYGESDPHPTRTLKSLAFDIEELADQLGLGSKFYVAGFSMGGQLVWTCLKYIPHRLAGAALIAPAISYWWPGIPLNMSQAAYKQRLVQDQWALRVAHHMPWLFYWWNTQKLFPVLSVIAHNPNILSPQDKDVIPKMVAIRKEYLAQVRQQGEYESVYRDATIGYGKWEFDPMDLKNLSLGSDVPVHLWQGDEDLLVFVELQCYIASQLPWIRYHELSGAGHLFLYANGVADSIMQALVGGKQS